MPLLRNPRHERFAQELATGKTADAAYVLAGYKENRSNAARLGADRDIQARLAEIQSVGAERAAITHELCNHLSPRRPSPARCRPSDPNIHQGLLEADTN